MSLVGLRFAGSVAIHAEDALAFDRLVGDRVNGQSKDTEHVHPIHATSAVNGLVSQHLGPVLGGALVVHFGQWVRIGTSVLPGTVLTVRATVTNVSKARSGFLLEVSAEASTSDARVIACRSLLLTSSLQTSDVLSGTRGSSRWTQPIKCGPNDWNDRLTYRVTTEEIAAFGGCTGDIQPLHMSEDWAKAAGFPSVIAHGMHTLAMCWQAATAASPGATARLAEIGMRFARPVLPMSPVTVQISPRGAVLFIRALSTGRAITRGGYAAFATTEASEMDQSMDVPR